MNRQRSILSFLRRPPSEDHPSSNSHSDPLDRRSPAKDAPFSIPVAPSKPPFPEVRGTDTPPAKLSRPVFPSELPSSGAADRGAPQPFSSIMHKFVRNDRSGSSSNGNLDCTSSFAQSSKSCESREDQIHVRNETDQSNLFGKEERLSWDIPDSFFSLLDGKFNGVDKDSSSAQPKFDELDRTHVDSKTETPLQNRSSDFFSMLDGRYGGGVLPPFQLSDDMLGPETPANRPLVHRLKRVHEDTCNAGDTCSPLLGSIKKPKFVQDPAVEEINKGGLCESTLSKFEWLNPSSIRDADGRRPTDPLYDKRTLYIPPVEFNKMSASQKQYWTEKCRYMDVVLFFKVGKFYELYELDAEIGHKELDWKMTISGVGKCRQVGISEAGIDDAVQKLVAWGYKVGRMEQLESSDQAKARGSNSVIRRKLVNVSTPSTIADDSIGPDAVHLLVLKEETQVSEKGSTIYGFAFLDYAALKFWVGSICDDDSCASLGALLMQVSPKEILYESSGLSKETRKALIKYSSTGPSIMQLTPVSPTTIFLDASEIRKLIYSKGYFKNSSNPWTSVFDCTSHPELILYALGGLIDHLCRLLLHDSLCNGELLPYHVYKSCLKMDGQTLVNLEIFSNNHDGGLSGTLYKYLDHCITPSGKRLLRRWICHPLKNVDEINDRLDAVEGLTKHYGVLPGMVECLRRIPDLERLLGRVKATVCSSSALLLPLVGDKKLRQRIKDFGSLIKGLRIGVDLLINIQNENCGIKALSKIVEFPAQNELAELVNQFEAAFDNDFPNYKDHKVKDCDAETLAILVELFLGKAAEWSHMIQSLNCIDVLHSFAAIKNSSCASMSRPVFLTSNSHSMISHQNNKGPTLQIKGLWHPYAVGENGNDLVPNDILLGEDSAGHHPCALLLTGPNMGGKSTLLRATCLAVILAQLGCYVPCDTCVLSAADVIFTRLGATDRIMSGESTFFIECAETASVLHNATQDSLVLLDELGRGTSTFDGYAIAHAVFRHLVETVCCRLLFATHYHPLTKEFASHPRVRLQHMACAFRPRSEGTSDGEKDIVFLYRLAQGACPESYGLQVALMAGIPKPVVDAASIASQRMRHMISENFRSSEGRSEFSTLHEEWLKTVFAVSKISEDCWNEDTSDTLLCPWHELKNFYSISR